MEQKFIHKEKCDIFPCKTLVLFSLRKKGICKGSSGPPPPETPTQLPETKSVAVASSGSQMGVCSLGGGGQNEENCKHPPWGGSPWQHRHRNWGAGPQTTLAVSWESMLKPSGLEARLSKGLRNVGGRGQLCAYGTLLLCRPPPLLNWPGHGGPPQGGGPRPKEQPSG